MVGVEFELFVVVDARKVVVRCDESVRRECLWLHAFCDDLLRV